MTREEAIEKLEAFAPMVVDDTREALDMAIEALQAEPVVRCKDCTHRYQHDSGRYFCEMYYGMGDVSDENYCSFGER